MRTLLLMSSEQTWHVQAEFWERAGLHNFSLMDCLEFYNCIKVLNHLQRSCFSVGKRKAGKARIAQLNKKRNKKETC